MEGLSRRRHHETDNCNEMTRCYGYFIRSSHGSTGCGLAHKLSLSSHSPYSNPSSTVIIPTPPTVQSPP